MEKYAFAERRDVFGRTDETEADESDGTAQHDDAEAQHYGEGERLERHQRGPAAILRTPPLCHEGRRRHAQEEEHLKNYAQDHARGGGAGELADVGQPAEHCRVDDAEERNG